MMKCDPRAQARCPYNKQCGENPIFSDGSDCDKFNQKVLEPPHTNADRIRAMRDEELAAILVCSFDEPTDLCKSTDMDCAACMLDWLRRPVEEGAALKGVSE